MISLMCMALAYDIEIQLLDYLAQILFNLIISYTNFKNEYLFNNELNWKNKKFKVDINKEVSSL